MMRKGFALLEVTFALFLSAMIALVLFESLSQTNSILSRVTSVSMLERRVMVMQQQFESDFSGRAEVTALGAFQLPIESSVMRGITDNWGQILLDVGLAIQLLNRRAFSEGLIHQELAFATGLVEAGHDLSK